MRGLTIRSSLDEARALSQNDDEAKLRNAGRSLCDSFKLFLANVGAETYSGYIENQTIINRFRLLQSSLPELRNYGGLAMKLDKLRHSIEHSDTYSPRKEVLQDLITQTEPLFKMVAPLKERLRSQRTLEESREFSQRTMEEWRDVYFSFSRLLDDLVLRLERASRPSDLENLLKQLVDLFKQVFENLDLRWAKMATRELFMKLYRINERSEVELYTIFKNVFAYAHDQGPEVLESMVDALDAIMQDSWGAIDDVEKAEKATELILRLGIDFLERDISVTERCAIAITNLASDMFEPKILAKQIVLAACANEMSRNNLEAQALTQDLASWIEDNDQYAWDAGLLTYLRDSVEFARANQTQYGVDIGVFEKDFVAPALLRNIQVNIAGYVASLEGLKRHHLSLAREELVGMISDYRGLRPGIAQEVNRCVRETKNQKIATAFDRIVKGDKILRNIYASALATK